MEPITCAQCGLIVAPIVRKYPDLSDPGGGVVHISAWCRHCGRRDQRTIDIPGLWSQAFRRPKPADRDRRGP